MMEDAAGVARTSRAESCGRRGLTVLDSEKEAEVVDGAAPQSDAASGE